VWGKEIDPEGKKIRYRYYTGPLGKTEDLLMPLGDGTVKYPISSQKEKKEREMYIMMTGKEKK